MASFTEQATLKVVDQSSAQLRKINAELKKLMTTARSLKSITVNIKVNDAGLTKATASVKQLSAALRTLRSSTISIKANVSGLAAAQRQVSNIRQQAARPITINTRHAGGGSGPAGPGGPNRPGARFGGGGAGRTPGSAFTGGFAGGMGAGLSRLNESFGLVAVAGFAAAKALRAVANAAEERDRTELAVDTQTSPAQRALFKKIDEEAKARGDLPPALRYKKNQFQSARASFMGDVGNSDQFKTPEQLASIPAQLERAARADILARKLFADVVPGMYARKPDMTQPQAQEELLKVVQTLGITTQEMFTKNAQGQQVLSKDAERVLEGINIAQRAAPDLTLAQIRTAAASIKSLGYTATPQQIAETLFNVSAKGQRAAGEAYQMYKTGLGTTDVGKLNGAIERLGGFIEGTAKPGKKPGTVQAGTGIPREFDDPENPDRPIKLAEQPSEWWRRLLQEPAPRKKLADDMAKQASGSLGPKATKKERQSAEKAARDRVAAGQETAAERADFVNRTLSGARSTALQGILDAWLGGEIAKSGLAQAAGTPGPREIETMMAERWSVQLTNLGTAVSDAAGDLGKLAAESINLAGILSGMTKFVEQNPLTSGALAVGVGVAVGAAMLAPAAMLMSAAGALTAAAAVMRGGAAANAVGNVIGSVGTLGTIMRVGGVLMRVAGGAAIALTAAEIAYYNATRSTEQAQKDEKQVQAQKDLAVKEAAASRIEQEQYVQRDTPQSDAQKAYMAKEAEKLVNLKQQIAELYKILEQKPVGEADAATKPPDTNMDAITAAVIKAVAEQNAKNPPKPTEPIKAQPIKSTATERAETAAAVAAAVKTATPTAASTATATTTAAAPAPDSLAALVPQLAKTSESITLAISGLTTAGNTFTTVFSTGASAITTAGSTAATTLSNAAPSIGAAIGNAAAKAISAAAAQVSINVNHTGEQPNTGKSTP